MQNSTNFLNMGIPFVCFTSPRSSSICTISYDFVDAINYQCYNIRMIAKSPAPIVFRCEIEYSLPAPEAVAEVAEVRTGLAGLAGLADGWVLFSILHSTRALVAFNQISLPGRSLVVSLHVYGHSVRNSDIIELCDDHQDDSELV